MRILVPITYYVPHLSGLTRYATVLAEGLAARGHDISILTSRFKDDLPEEERIRGVRVRRVPVARRFGKGILYKNYSKFLREELANADAMLAHLPLTPFEALRAIPRARLNGKRVVSLLHCDVRLARGFLNFFMESGARFGSFIACLFSNRIIVNSEDYGRSLWWLKPFLGKVSGHYPPVERPLPDPARTAEIRRTALVGCGEGTKLVAFVGRWSREKGVETLLRAMQELEKKGIAVKTLHAGPVSEVMGEEKFRERTFPEAQALGPNRFQSLGVMEDPDLSALFAACDLTVFPSLDSTESFGLVQVESFLSGTPVVASDLPGVREAVLATGMGLTFSPNRHEALVRAIEEVFRKPEWFRKSRESVAPIFSEAKSLDAFENALKGEFR